MKFEVDLHLHTTSSDGTLTPSELVRLCDHRGLQVISISDHDSTEGLREAFKEAENFPDMTIIPGIELSTEVPDSEIHLLGYFVDYEDAKFQNTLTRLRKGRERRGMMMVDKLNALGLNLSWERVQEIANGAAIGRPHIALAMVEREYVKYPRDAFSKYLGRDSLAYVEREKLTPVQAISMLKDNGAVPVLAHPTYSSSKSGRAAVADLRTKLSEMKNAGLAGMEVYYGDYTPKQMRSMESLAREFGLVPCGGSDYHAIGNPNEPEPGTIGPPMSTVDALRQLATEVRLKAHRT